jgi:hypothetical protein
MTDQTHPNTITAQINWINPKITFGAMSPLSLAQQAATIVPIPGKKIFKTKQTMWNGAFTLGIYLKNLLYF